MRFTAARIALPVAVAIVLLVATVGVAPAPAAAQESEDGTTTLAFALEPDGDAQVTVTLRLVLDGESGERAFEELAAAHREGEGSPLTVDPFVRAAELASESTGRAMAVEGVERTAEAEAGIGRLRIAFTWTGFARASEGRLVLGDVFQRPGGTWLPGLEPGQELRISFPEGYTPQDISIPGTRFQVVNGTVLVSGPASFEPGTPAIVLQQPGVGTETPGPDGLPDTAILGGLALLGLLVIAGLLYTVRDRLPSFEVGGTRAEATDGEDEEPPDPMEEPLLSDEERVLRLLEAEDGRMKQVEIVEATDWSNAKVSQLLSEMEAAGKVDKLRIGRENLISLPGRGPGEE